MRFQPSHDSASTPAVWLPPPQQHMAPPSANAPTDSSASLRSSVAAQPVVRRSRAGPVAEGKADAPEPDDANAALLPPSGADAGADSTAAVVPEDVLWEGSTWDACPLWAACCAPLCCMSKRWRITKHAIDVEWGCCGDNADSMLMRSVRDVQFEGHLCMRLCCCGRATITIHDGDATHREPLHLTTVRAKRLYHTVKDELRAQRSHAHDPRLD